MPAGDLDAAVDAWLESILTAGPNAIRLQKRLIREWEQRTPEEAVRAGPPCYDHAHATLYRPALQFKDRDQSHGRP